MSNSTPQRELFDKMTPEERADWDAFHEGYWRKLEQLEVDYANEKADLHKQFMEDCMDFEAKVNKRLKGN